MRGAGVRERAKPGSRVAVLCTAALVLIGAACTRAGRDVARPGPGADSSHGHVAPGEPERTLSISPESGPPGTEVHLTGHGYAPSATVQIGVGPVDAEYEVVASAQTSAGGELKATAVIPAPARGGRSYVFVATQESAPWKVVSNPFTITSDTMSNKPGAVITIRGTLTDEGVECQAMRAEGGALYTLTGDLGGLQTGDRVRVEGVVAEISFCQQGTTINVSAIERL